MKYLHAMVRVKDLEVSLRFWCGIFGLQEVRRVEHEQGRFTLVFLVASDDVERGKDEKAPLLELTYNWPDENGQTEEYQGGRNFGHLTYEVDDIHDFCQTLMDAGVTINRPPRDGRMAFIVSPEGISIELLQKGDALTPSEPWVSMENTGTW